MFVSNAYAQAAGAAPVDSSPMAQFFAGGMSFPVMMALMFGILYFMVIRPQNAERKKLQKAIDELKKGDKVLTTSGMFATVVSMEADRAILKINDETKVEFAKSAIASVVSAESK
ncbi:MAG: preprotein translocase subunit YajC [Candidatus Eisenbacteria bacterium]|nr:preprotein translocase subunit YajC [Candidatus Eisenbacteria bacterium]